VIAKTAQTVESARGIRPVILVVDDEPGIRESFRLILGDEYDVLEAGDGAQALKLVRAREVNLVLLDIRLPGMDGIEVLERIKALDEHVGVVLVTAVNAVRIAVGAIKLGAYDYLTKPFDVEEILSVVRRALDKQTLEREVRYLRSEMFSQHGFDAIVGRHPEMVKVYQLIASVAQTNATVLISGESGTGKELVARAIHRQGPRRDKPFIAVNLAAVPEPLMESELFGHEKGAFTGAYQKTLGKFELAHGGTLFLDEVASLGVHLQAKLLRVLQEREVERIGGSRSVKVDVRILAATNSDLKQAVRARTFREDIYYRLNVISIEVPPLRDRLDDIPLLVDHFIEKYNREFHKAVKGISQDALAILHDYRWPGNVRELENVIERALALARGPVIHLRDLPLDLALSGDGSQGRDDGQRSLKEARDQFERQFVLRALERVDWNQSRAARLLGLHRNTLKEKLTGWGVRRPVANRS
jgi:two-component system response regulator AtoC